MTTMTMMKRRSLGVTSTITAAAAAAAAASCILLQSSRRVAADPPVWCVNDGSLTECQEVIGLLNAESTTNNDANNNPVPVASCIESSSTTAGSCAAAFEQGEVHILSDVDLGELYEFSLESSSFRVIAEEVAPAYQGITGYYGVILTTGDQCDEPGSPLYNGWESFRGKSSVDLSVCSTGFDKTSGWKLTMGTLMSEGLVNMKVSGAEDNDIVTARTFFTGGMCVSMGDDVMQQTYLDSAMCSQCGGLSDDSRCSQIECVDESVDQCEPYTGYGGSFRGLVEGQCQVAFHRQRTVYRYTDSEGRFPEFETDDTRSGDKFSVTQALGWNWGPDGASPDRFRFVCRTECRSISNKTYELPECNTGKTAGHSTVVNTETVDFIALLKLEAAIASAGGPSGSLAMSGYLDDGTMFDSGTEYLRATGLAKPSTLAPQAFEAFDQLNTVRNIKCKNPDINGDGELDTQDVQMLEACIMSSDTDSDACKDIGWWPNLVDQKK